MKIDYEQFKVAKHHDEQFGDKDLVARALKLAEEVGEVAGAVVRHNERRDDRTWVTEISQECGDVFIVLLGLLAKLGVPASEVFDDAIYGFLRREWNVKA